MEQNDDPERYKHIYGHLTYENYNPREHGERNHVFNKWFWE